MFLVAKCIFKILLDTEITGRNSRDFWRRRAFALVGVREKNYYFDVPTFHLFPDADFVREFRASITPDLARMEALSVFLTQQVRERFRTAGASGGANWPAKFTTMIGAPDGRAILTGATARLLGSFQGYADGSSAVVYSDDPKSLIHQLGTTKYGGPIPTIRPKNAKALFIPITDRAQSSQRIVGQPAAHYRAGVGKLEPGLASQLPLRVATRGKKVSRGGVKYFAPLVKGRLKDGKLQRWDERAGEYVDGIPDFIFLMKVDIRPRPMLPDSPGEQRAQDEFVADLLSPR